MPHGIHPGFPEAEYHADPAFSQSQAKTLLESPARYLWRLTHPEPPRDVFDIGSAVHSEVLGVGAPVIEIPESVLGKNGATNTNACREFEAQARADGLIPLKAEVIARVDGMTAAVLAHPHARAAFEAEGDVELSMWWTDPGSGVEARGRVDKAAALDDGIALVDLKTTTDGSPRGFASSAAKYGYRLQGGAYFDGWTLASGEQPASFLFVTVEKEPPHLVGTYSLAPLDLEAGLDKWRHACALLADYRARDEWPAYPSDPAPFAHLDLPAWAL